MAPTRRSRNSLEAKKDEKKHNIRRPVNAEPIYKKIGRLCGEDCDQELRPVTDATDVTSIYSDDDLEMPKTQAAKSGRVAKLKTKKLPLKVGVQKAQRYICEALDFGLESGYLSHKDKKGAVLALSPELIEMSKAIKESANATSKRHAAALADESAARKLNRKRRSPNKTMGSDLEERDDEGDVDEARARRRHRSRSRRGGRRRSGRSRSRSKRRSRRRAGSRSRSMNIEPESRSKQNKSEESPQDAMEENNNKELGSRNDAEDNEDAKSVKSSKSVKSVQRMEQRSGAEDKKHSEDDASTDDEEDKKK